MQVPDSPSRFVVALTGGVAAGKSAAARRFESLGIRVHDADLAAREVVAPGQAALAEIEFVFGARVLNADGALDRRALRERIFDDAEARRRLEAIVHPRVREWLRRRVAADRGPYCVLMIPLLAETWPQYDWVDRVLVVDAPEDVQIERLMRRDDVTHAQARRTLDAQATRAQRRALAQDVIVNDGDEAGLDPQVDALHARYLELAAFKRAQMH
ncbi:MAG TPA: dephospho-CoA kinase [Rhodanobacteraceae bacterium]|nr:dephospho-CoA kinase [Rhodanobacteraceae bacterium]